MKKEFISLLFEDNKFNWKDNVHVTIIINKTNKNIDISFIKNKLNNKTKNKASINENKHNTIEEKDKKINIPKNKKYFKTKGNN